jgi:cold shock CspA family protein
LRGRDVFVHARQIERSGLNTLLSDQKVEYNLVDREHGRQEAQNLRIVE